MKTVFPRTLERSGFALMMVLFTLIAMSLVFGSVALWLSSSSKQSAENNSFTTSKAAAEGATEMAFAEMDRDYLLSSLGSESSYETILPVMTNWPVQFTFSDTNGSTGRISVSIGDESSSLQPLGGQFASLEGYVRTITITANATPTGQIYNQPATVQEQFTFATVPAFQFAIFYNINLEIDPGATMPIRGSVFSNGGIWSGDSDPTYYSTVEAAGQANITGNDPFLSTYTNNGGTPTGNFLDGQAVSGVDPLEIPIGASGTNNSETNVIAIIQLPPSSVAAPQSIAYAESNQVYTFNEATLIVSNWSKGTYSNAPSGNNFSVYLQDPWTGPSYCSPSTGHWNQLTNDFYIVTNYYTIKTNPTTFTTLVTSNLFSLPGFTTNTIPSTIDPWSPAANVGLTWQTGTSLTVITNWGVKYAGWTWLTNVSFYDYRESDTVQAVQIDVGLLRTWITNSPKFNGGSNWNYALAYDKGSGINSIYVYNSVPETSTVLPAVRAINGLRLPNSTNLINNTNNITCGLTIVTPQPMYVYGTYNVQTDGDSSAITYFPGTNNMAHTYPAAFMADAITILSTSWRDSTYVSTTSLSSRSPTLTCVNAACLEGIVQSSSSAPMSSAINGYSGGVENFLRLLEDWSSSAPLYYNGSIMVMFPSQYATNWWQETGNYYNAPTRVWSFDSNFTNQLDLPPLTPKFTAVLRTNWAGY